MYEQSTREKKSKYNSGHLSVADEPAAQWLKRLIYLTAGSSLRLKLI